MKKIFLMLIFLSALPMPAQNRTDILQSTNISEIENFLRSAHPDDPRRSVLKPKLIALKNASWTNNSSYKQLNPIVLNATKIPVQKRMMNEEEEFRKLLAENSANHKAKTVQLLNQLFNNDVSNREAILLMQNNSDCNMIVRIVGQQVYNLAVPAHGENSVVLKKGDYLLKSNVCNAPYSSAKKIEKSTIVSLSQPVVQFVSTAYAAQSGGVSN